MITEDILFSLLRREITGAQVSDGIIELCTKENLENVFLLAKSHSVAHLAADAVESLGLADSDSELYKKFAGIKKQTVFMYLKQNVAYEQLTAALTEAGIPFIPLKGAVIRKLYPEQWMRNSCDIDVLVHSEDTERAAEVLMSRLGYESNFFGKHDISFITPDRQHVELHFSLLDEDSFPRADAILGDVWEYARESGDERGELELSDELFYFYHIVHMAKHLKGGGCGIRPFIDLWLLNRRVEFDSAKRRQLLEKGGLLTFADAAERISEYWMNLTPLDSERYADSVLKDYVLRGGVYGSDSNKQAVDSSDLPMQTGGLIKKLWKPYAQLKYWYPHLNGRRYLLPFYEVKRWILLIQNTVGSSFRSKRTRTAPCVPVDTMLKELELR